MSCGIGAASAYGSLGRTSCKRQGGERVESPGQSLHVALSWAKLVRKSAGISAGCGISPLQADPAVQVLALRGGAAGESGKSFQDPGHLLRRGVTEFLRLRPFRKGSCEPFAAGQR